MIVAIPGLGLSDGPPPFVELHEGPSAAEFQDDVDKVLVLEEGEEFDDVQVVEGLVQRDLLGHLVPLVGLLEQGLGHNLAGDHFAIVHVLQLVHFGKTTLKRRGSQEIISMN